MGLFNHFPYPDTHQLNLDWILDVVKTCVDKVTELWTYVREPGAGIQKALTDAQAAATSAQTSATSAQTSATSAQEAATTAQTSAQSAQSALTDANAAANTAQTSARNAQTYAMNANNSANEAEQYLADIQAMMGKLYPVGAFYANLMVHSDSDATVIARLQALTGGTWAIAGVFGQPVQDPAERGRTTFVIVDKDGTNFSYNINVYVRTA